MNNDIQHKGIIFDIVGNRIDVSVTAESACGSCKVKGSCGMSESKEKNVSVISDNPDSYRVGEEVMVSVGKAMGIRAVVLAYVVPLFMLLAILLILVQAGVGEVAAGLASIAAVAVWYVALWIFRKKIGQEIIFKIRKYDE